MRHASFLVGFLLLLGIASLWLVAHAASSPSSSPSTTTSSVMFIENVGQFGAWARFQSQSEIGTMFVAKDGALWFTFLEPLDAPAHDAMQRGEEEPPLRGGVNVRLSFVGANPNPQIESFLPLTTSVNYLQGNDPSRWYTHVPVWGGVRYRELYPGIDLELSSTAHHATRRWVVTDPQRAHLASIALQVEGTEISMTEEGKPIFQTSFGTIPVPLFEVQSAEPLFLPAPHLTGSVVQSPFQASPDSMTVLTSPTSTLLPSNLHYSTLLGGADHDFAYAVAVDDAGSIYMGGLTQSFDFPTTPGAFDPDVGTPVAVYNAYLTKLNPDGTRLEYSTFLQGNNVDQVHGIVLDSSGAVYVTGQTRSSNFPTTPDSVQPTFGGHVDAFLLKLSPNGSVLEYGTYLGGSSIDIGRDLALSSNGEITVVGQTASRNFPTTPNAYDTELGGTEDEFDIFVSKIATNGSTFVYSTYLGGIRDEDGWGVAIDPTGSAYIAGMTGNSGTYPTTPGVFDPSPDFLAFVVTKLTPDGSDLIYSTGVGTQAENEPGDIALNDKNEVYVVASVANPGFPATAGAYDTECGSAGVGCGSPQNQGDGVLFQLNADGSEMIFGTFLGGQSDDTAYKVHLDSENNVYVIGYMESADVIPSNGAYRSPIGGCGLWKFNSIGSELLHFATPPYRGCETMALEADDTIIFAGYVPSGTHTYETTPNAYDTIPNGENDAVAGRLLLTFEATTSTIPTTGGTLSSHPDNTTYIFPANSISETAVFTHAPRHPLSLPPVAPFITVGEPFVNYAIGTDGQTPLQPLHPYTIDIYYDPSDLGGQGSVLGLYYWDGSAWLPEPSTLIDPTTHHLLATPSRFGWWAILRHPNQLYLPSTRR